MRYIILHNIGYVTFCTGRFKVVTTKVISGNVIVLYDNF